MRNWIKAVWTKGQIVPAEPVHWPEGSALLVEPVVPNGATTGITEEDWRDDPDSIAAWITAVERIEPAIWQPGEREAVEQFRSQQREFNIESVRKQMQEKTGGDAP